MLMLVMMGKVYVEHEKKMSRKKEREMARMNGSPQAGDLKRGVSMFGQSRRRRGSFRQSLMHRTKSFTESFHRTPSGHPGERKSPLVLQLPGRGEVQQMSLSNSKGHPASKSGSVQTSEADLIEKYKQYKAQLERHMQAQQTGNYSELRAKLEQKQRDRNPRDGSDGLSDSEHTTPSSASPAQQENRLGDLGAREVMSEPSSGDEADTMLRHKCLTGYAVAGLRKKKTTGPSSMAKSKSEVAKEKSNPQDRRTSADSMATSVDNPEPPAQVPRKESLKSDMSAIETADTTRRVSASTAASTEAGTAKPPTGAARPPARGATGATRNRTRSGTGAKPAPKPARGGVTPRSGHAARGGVTPQSGQAVRGCGTPRVGSSTLPKPAATPRKSGTSRTGFVAPRPRGASTRR
eukprot:TRINITY_DN22125_c0_g1_i1.p1 TRINITY_DN22125_c0_g1~~TRINITY_DN22125_c0_g1_i1.p1  ORF type:complete len:407 (+),score=66.83 TRINITY_DN22125_c0_g1_i1:69-1289(+)